jgi:hypothetical protein
MQMAFAKPLFILGTPIARLQKKLSLCIFIEVTDTKIAYWLSPAKLPDKY